MLERYLGPDKQAPLGWDELGHGAPTIIALARLAANALQAPDESIAKDLSDEAKAILYTARARGVVEIRSSNQAFDSVDRFLTVSVEARPDQHIRFGSKESPRQKIRFLEGFASLCAAGLVVHHSYHEFSLTSAGFEIAESIDRDSIEKQLQQGLSSDGNEW